MTIAALASLCSLHPEFFSRVSPVYASIVGPAMRRRITARASRRSPRMTAMPVVLPTFTAPTLSGARASDPVRIVMYLAVPSAMTRIIVCPLCASHIVNVHGAPRCRATSTTSAAPCDCCGVNVDPFGLSLSDRTPAAFTARAYERCRIAALDYCYALPVNEPPAPLADIFAAVRASLAAIRA